MIDEPRVTVRLGPMNHVLTVSEARDFIRLLQGKINELKVKCSGCRCMLVPGDTCYCCDLAPITDD